MPLPAPARRESERAKKGEDLSLAVGRAARRKLASRSRMSGKAFRWAYASKRPRPLAAGQAAAGRARSSGKTAPKAPASHKFAAPADSISVRARPGEQMERGQSGRSYIIIRTTTAGHSPKQPQAPMLLLALALMICLSAASKLEDEPQQEAGASGAGAAPDAGGHTTSVKWLLTCVYLIIFLIGVVGNLCNCLVIADSRNRYMKTATNYYLFSLSISDLLLLIFGLPHDLVNLWHPSPYLFNQFVCISRGWISEASTYASVLVIVAFTVERYLAICHPLRAHTLSRLSRSIKIIVIIWLVASSCALVVVMQFGLQVTFYDELTGQPLGGEAPAAKSAAAAAAAAAAQPSSSSLGANASLESLLAGGANQRAPAIRTVAECTTVALDERVFELSVLIFFIVPMAVISILYVRLGYHLRKKTDALSRARKQRSAHQRQQQQQQQQQQQHLSCQQASSVVSAECASIALQVGAALGAGPLRDSVSSSCNNDAQLNAGVKRESSQGSVRQSEHTDRKWAERGGANPAPEQVRGRCTCAGGGSSPASSSPPFHKNPTGQLTTIAICAAEPPAAPAGQAPRRWLIESPLAAARAELAARSCSGESIKGDKWELQSNAPRGARPAAEPEAGPEQEPRLGRTRLELCEARAGAPHDHKSDDRDGDGRSSGGAGFKRVGVCPLACQAAPKLGPVPIRAVAAGAEQLGVCSALREPSALPGNNNYHQLGGGANSAISSTTTATTTTTTNNNNNKIQLNSTVNASNMRSVIKMLGE